MRSNRKDSLGLVKKCLLCDRELELMNFPRNSIYTIALHFLLALQFCELFVASQLSAVEEARGAFESIWLSPRMNDSNLGHVKCQMFVASFSLNWPPNSGNWPRVFSIELLWFHVWISNSVALLLMTSTGLRSWNINHPQNEVAHREPPKSETFLNEPQMTAKKPELKPRAIVFFDIRNCSKLIVTAHVFSDNQIVKSNSFTSCERVTIEFWKLAFDNDSEIGIRLR